MCGTDLGASVLVGCNLTAVYGTGTVQMVYCLLVRCPLTVTKCGRSLMREATKESLSTAQTHSTCEPNSAEFRFKTAKPDHSLSIRCAH